MSILVKIVRYLLSIFISIHLIQAAIFPADIKRCKVADPNCVAFAATEFIKNNKNGRPELGIPSLDPFTLNQLVISQSNGGSIEMNLIVKNLKIYGLSNLVFDKVIGFDADPRTSKFELFASVPKLIVKSNYKIDGRVSLLPIQGNGNLDIEVTNLELGIKIKPHVTFDSEGNQFLKIDKLKLRINPSDIHLNISNLFNNDKALGDRANEYINSNWRDVWEEISPSVTSAVSNVVKTVIENFSTKFSYNELLLDA